MLDCPRLFDDACKSCGNRKDVQTATKVVREVSYCTEMHAAVVQVAHMFQVMKMEETPLVASQPGEAMWSAMVSSLVFSWDQQASLMQHRRHFYSTLGNLLQDQTAAQDLWVWQTCLYPDALFPPAPPPPPPTRAPTHTHTHTAILVYNTQFTAGPQGWLGRLYTAEKSPLHEVPPPFRPPSWPPKASSTTNILQRGKAAVDTCL